MISSEWKFGKDIPEVNEIREACGFIPLKTDEKALHLILYENSVPVACGSLFFDSGAYRVANACVAEDKRGEHIGDLLLRLLLVRGFNMLADKIVITPTPETVGFFSKYGFKQTKTAEMEVDAQGLILDSKCGHNCKECLNQCTQK